MKFRDRLAHSWNAFRNKDPIVYNQMIYGESSGPRPRFLQSGTGQTIIAPVYNRIAADVVDGEFQHVRVDENNNYQETILSGLNNILTTSANVDQSGRDFMLDLVLTMLEDGAAAAVPIDTTVNPKVTGSYDIQTMRVGRIVEWHPKIIIVDLYNDGTGMHEQIPLAKSYVGIVVNPFYSVFNQENSVMKRLTSKIALLDMVDNQSGSGKLDMIIQLPYTIKSDARRTQAEERKKQIEDQLANSKYGIAYADATEHITQLNRPVDNNLATQVATLTAMLYAQLGLTDGIMNGTADDKTMTSYYKRIIGLITKVICDEFRRTFLTSTARTQNQTIVYHRDPFALATTEELSNVADKFRRNEILTSNELRSIVGFRPSNAEQANDLSNPNLNQQNTTDETNQPPADSSD